MVAMPVEQDTNFFSNDGKEHLMKMFSFSTERQSGCLLESKSAKWHTKRFSWESRVGLQSISVRWATIEYGSRSDMRKIPEGTRGFLQLEDPLREVSIFLAYGCLSIDPLI
jgi:hypothetical protein